MNTTPAAPPFKRGKYEKEPRVSDLQVLVLQEQLSLLHEQRKVAEEQRLNEMKKRYLLELQITAQQHDLLTQGIHFEADPTETDVRRQTVTYNVNVANQFEELNQSNEEDANDFGETVVRPSEY